MEALLEQVLATHKSAMQDVACMELKNRALEEEVSKLKNKIAELMNHGRCPSCGERPESMKNDVTQNVHPVESTCNKSVENLVFDDEADTTILRRQKRRKKGELSSQEQKKQKMIGADVTDGPLVSDRKQSPRHELVTANSPVVDRKTSKRHKLMRKLETENTQFPETLNPAQILVGQTCDIVVDVNNRKEEDKNDMEYCDQISVIPETVPMDFVPDDEEEEDREDFSKEQNYLNPVSNKSVVFIDTSDNDSLRDVPESVRKMFIGSQTSDRTPKTKPPLLDFDAGEKVIESVTPGSKTRGDGRAKSVTPESHKAKPGDISTQFGLSQCLQFVSDFASQTEEKSDTEGKTSQYSPVKKGGKGQRRNSKSNGFSQIGNESDGSRSPVFNGVRHLNNEGDHRMDQLLPDLASGTNSKKSPVISQGFKFGSKPSSSLGDSPMVLKVVWNGKNMPLDQKVDEMQIDVTDKLKTDSFIVGQNGIKKNVSHIEKHDDVGLRNDANFRKNSVNSMSRSSVNSQESEMSGSQSLVSSRMALNRSSNRQKETDMNYSGETNSTRSLALSKSDSHLQQWKKSKSGGLIPSPKKPKHASLPNSPLSASQRFNTKLATEARCSDDEFKSDVGFKNSAEEVWLSAKKPEPKKQRVKTPLNITLNTTVMSSPKNFRQQTINLTLKKNTEMDLSETGNFNGGVLVSKKSESAEKVVGPNLSFEFDEDDEEDENVPPSPQKPSQRFRRPKMFATGAKIEKKRASLDVTYDPDMTHFPLGTDGGSQVTCIDASPCFKKNTATPIGTTETYFHESVMDTSYSLIPAVKCNGTIDPDLNLSAYVDSVVPNNDQSEMSDSRSLVFGKERNDRFGNGGNPVTGKNDENSFGRKNIAGSSVQSEGDPLLRTESILSEEVPFHSTCRSVTFGKGGTVSTGLLPNFSELASEIPQNSEFPLVPGDEVSLNRRKTRNRSHIGKPEVDLLDSDVSHPVSQSSKLGSRKAKNGSQKKSPEKPILLLKPDYDSQLDFAGQDLEKSFKLSGRPKRGIKSQETAPSTLSRKPRSKARQNKFEASEDSDDNSKNKSYKFSRKSKQGFNETSKGDVSDATDENGSRFTLPDATSYVLTEKMDDAVKVSGEGGYSEYDDDAMMVDMCKSMKFGARPKTFAAESQSPDEMDDLLFNANEAGSKVSEGRTEPLGDENHKEIDLEEDSQGVGGDDDYPCPGIVATPVDETEKSVSRRKREERKAEQLMDDSFDRVPKEDGPDYAYYKVERNRQKRTHCMHGHDCAGCKDYYDHLPEEERNKRMQASSRHRAYYVPPDTPPNFWCLKIPSSQSLSMKMKGHLDESYSEGAASVKSSKPKPVKAKQKFRRKNKLTILPPKFDDKS